MTLARIQLFSPDAEPSQPTFEGPTASEVIDLYLTFLGARLAAGDYSKGRLQGETRYLRDFEQFTGDFRKPLGAFHLEELKQHHFTTWWMGNFQRWNSDYSKRDAKAAVLAAFRWAQDEDIIAYVPFTRPRRVRLVLQPRKPLRTQDYVTLMTEALTCNKRRPDRTDLPEFRRRRRKGSLALRKACFFMRHTGARPGEMRTAEWRDIEWHAGTIRLFNHKTARITGKDRLMGLDEQTFAFLRRTFERLRPEPTDAIFRNAEGELWTKDTFCRHFKRHAEKAGLDDELTAYGLRHGFATEGILRGVPEKGIADQLGHKDTRMMGHYSATSKRDAGHLRNVVGQVTEKPKREPKPKQRKDDTPLFDGLD